MSAKVVEKNLVLVYNILFFIKNEYKAFRISKVIGIPAPPY